jgi:hypothetical protein
MKEPSNEFDHTINQMREEGRKPMSLLDLKPDRYEQKNKQAEEWRMNLGEKNLSSLESLNQLVAPLTLTVNSALATFSVLIENGEGFAQRLSGSDKKEQFREYFLKMRKDYDEVAVISKSMAEFTRLVADRSSGFVDATQQKKKELTKIDTPQSAKDSSR